MCMCACVISYIWKKNLLYKHEIQNRLDYNKFMLLNVHRYDTNNTTDYIR